VSPGRTAPPVDIWPPAAAADGAEQAGPVELVVRGYGPGGAALAGHLAGRVPAWQAAGRPGATDLRLSVWPRGARVRPAAGQVVLDRPNARIQLGWPPA
jgi:NADH dehydrogenase FAD-containing subunit